MQLIKYKYSPGFLLLLIQLSASLVCAQAPDLVSYQAVIRNNRGELVCGNTVGIRIQIKVDSEFGAAVYVETHVKETDQNGLVSLQIGGGTPVLGSMEDIDWANGTYFLQVETDPGGGTSYSITGVSQLLAVPYALHAKTAGIITGGLPEKDPEFVNSAAGTITENDIAGWNSKPGYIVEEDPVFKNSVAGGITKADTMKWNRKPGNEEQGLADVLELGNDAGGKPVKNIASPVNGDDLATKAYIDKLFTRIILLENTLASGGPVSDLDGNQYHTVRIGKQVWMTENLNVTKYSNGDPIPNVTPDSSWNELTSGAYCDYMNNPLNSLVYGKLYNHFTVSDPRNICPAGWHVPTEEEGNTLINYLGGRNLAGGKLKEKGTGHWILPNAGATNESGFTALPGGCRSVIFHDSGRFAGFWESTRGWSFTSGHVFYLDNRYNQASEAVSEKNTGYSVRCLKDDESCGIPKLSTTPIKLVLQNSAQTGGANISESGFPIREKGICYGTGINPDTSGNKIIYGNGPSDFTSLVPGLIPETTYHVRAYAINSRGIAYGDDLSFKTLAVIKFDSISDIDGNVYKTVRIGEQTWMAENLKTIHYNDGTDIPYAVYNRTCATTPAYYWIENNEAKNKNVYGAIYNFYTVQTGKLCPVGWRVPKNTDWVELSDRLGGSRVAGGKMKEPGTLHWINPNTGATNESGFSGLPGGWIIENMSRDIGGYYSSGAKSNWWSDSPYIKYPFSYSLYYENADLENMTNYEYAALSVRCIKGLDTVDSPVPLVTTIQVSNILQRTAYCSYEVHSDGGSAIVVKGVCWSTGPAPDTSDSKSVDGKNYFYNSFMSGLDINTKYYVRAYVITAGGVVYGNELSFTTKEELPYSSVTDRDGNVYKTIRIGSQLWMAEDLRVSHYNNGDPIPYLTPWRSVATGAYTYRNGEPANNKPYGKLYNFPVIADSRKVCPTGWHVPSNSEIQTLIQSSGGNDSSAYKLREAGTEHWPAEYNIATNETGFTALPGGRMAYSYYGGGFYLWSASQRIWTIPYYDRQMWEIGPDDSYYGCSVRCVKD